MKWIAANKINCMVGKRYYAKLGAIKATGVFNGYGDFIWTEQCYVPIKINELPHLLILDETPDPEQSSIEEKDKIISCLKTVMIAAAEEIKSSIQDAFYATGKFTTSDCELMAEGVLMYLNDAGFVIHKKEEYSSHQPFQQLISWMEEEKKECFKLLPDSHSGTTGKYYLKGFNSSLSACLTKAKELASQPGWVSVEERMPSFAKPLNEGHTKSAFGKDNPTVNIDQTYPPPAPKPKQ